jgi:hypothetical protein
MSQKLLTELLGPEKASELTPEEGAAMLRALVDHIGADAPLRRRLAEIVERELPTDLPSFSR